MKPSTGAAVRNHRNAVRLRPDSLSAFTGIRIPTMIIHGDDDRILPPDATSRRQAKMIKDVKYLEIKGGSHGMTWTHAEEINAELVKFLA